jgi:hypothetical protein
MTASGLSALPPEADIAQHGSNIRFVPITDTETTTEMNAARNARD